MEGTPFGRYQLIELLGRGGMGEVWRAHDTTIDRVVALKMLLPHYAQDETFEKRFRREARAAARLDDPHVVPIYDVGEIDGRLYVTMRLINGMDLQTLLDNGPLEPARAVHVVEQIASALPPASSYSAATPNLDQQRVVQPMPRRTAYPRRMVEAEDRGPVFDGVRIGRPAAGALLDAGYRAIADLPSDLDGLLALHGVGPKAVRLLRQARAG